MSLQEQFGAIDIYLFDQLLRGRITRADRIADAGCGFGRNLVHFLREGFDVFGVDADADAIAATRALAAQLAPQLPADRFHVARLDQAPWPDGFATVVISSAVLHFACDDAAFEVMLRGSWRLLAPGGLFFCRLASTIGMESRVARTPGALRGTQDSGRLDRRFRLPDGTDRYLVDEACLVDWTRTLGGKLLDPLKTTVVQDQRAMTTWVVRKD